MSDEQQGMDPAATFRLDQEAAQAEQATRDDTAWANHVRDQEATIQMKVEAAHLEMAKANLREAITLGIYAGVSVGGVWVAVQAVQGIVGWFQ